MDSQQSPIRVLVVDDHAVVRSGLLAFLSAFDDFELVGEAASGEEAIDRCEQLQPDVVLMDLVLPGLSGVGATQRIRQRWPHTAVIALTSYRDDDLVREALRSGAISYLLKTVSADELAEAIHRAHRGNATVSQEALSALVRTCDPQQQLGHDLTAREREVLALMVTGLSNQQIAQELTVALSTAKYHVSNVLSKLHVSSRGEAIAVALKRKLVV